MPPLACVDGNGPLDYGFFDETALPLPDEGSKGWATSKSSSLYRIDGWGDPYFFVNAEGNMAVRPHGKDTSPSEEIDIMKAVQKVVEARALGGLGLALPLIVRFPDVLKDRLEKLQSAFDRGISVQSYQGRFQGVFPVKCNQDRYVVENIVEFGKPYGFGLEAGSKPELLMAMACLCKGSPDAFLICNGYKDADYVSLALMARQLGLNCVIVLEQEEELDIVVRMSRQLCIEPVIGLRAKLNTKHGGHFGETSGEKGKFGLSSSEIVGIVHKLRRVGMLGCLQLLHFHIGSQIPSLAILNDGVSEAAHIYCELALMGANMKVIDIGGGLGIDYDGSNCAHSDMSVGYTIEEYGEEVVQAVKDACLMKNVKQPTLCSESGRALVSHHSVLVFDVLSVQQKGGKVGRDIGVSVEVEGLPEDLSSLHRRMIGHAREGDYESTLDCAKELKMECTDLFKRGRFSLMQLATINSIHEVVSAWVDERRHEKLSTMAMPKSLDQFSTVLLPKSFDHQFYYEEEQQQQQHAQAQAQAQQASDYTAVYQVNLSVFKSMPDTWAIGQLFPIVPIHRLEEQPTVRAILSDLTCDSDGKVGTFIGTDARGERMNHLAVHAMEAGKPYYMGMFLGGAYQEALGGMHNLFGSPNVVHVSHSGSGPNSNCITSNNSSSINSFKITRAIDGQTAADVLRLMQHEPNSMFEELKHRVQESLHEGRFGDDEEAALGVIHTLASSFASPTYLSSSSIAKSCYCAKKQPPIIIGSALEQAYCCT